jgi:hypothetical protein
MVCLNANNCTVLFAFLCNASKATVEVVNDTFTSTAIRAACYGSIMGGAKSSSCSAQACKVDIRIFTWFGPPKCNTLCPRRLYCNVCSTS